MPSIKIIVSCHKEVDYPNSDIYLPIEVGAVNHSQHIKNIQRDDEGDNISDRNFSFCELTAQYWAWKNIETDYIGLCHYRRYFYFGNQKYPMNDHMQIESDNLCPETHHKYCLTDNLLIHKHVELFDIIIPKMWDVRKTITKAGRMRSIKTHMEGYELLREKDLDLLLEIVTQMYPTYEPFVRKYLNGYRYIGYNCFIMKKKYFHELCEFEFGILKEFDRRFSYDNLSITQQRICGYLGEILFSAFVMKKLQERMLKIKEYPLVFFEYTEPVTRIDEICEPHKITVIWKPKDYSVAALSVAIRSFLLNTQKNSEYILFILSEQLTDKNLLMEWVGNVPDNVLIKYISEKNIDISMLTNESKIQLFANTDKILKAYLPWIIKKLDKILYLSGDMFFRKSPDYLLDLCGEDDCIAAPPSTGLLIQLNKFKGEELACNMASIGIGSAYDVLDDSLMIMNLKALRNASSESRATQYAHMLTGDAIESSLGWNAYIYPFRNNCLRLQDMTSVWETALVKESLPAKLISEYMSALQSACIVNFALSPPVYSPRIYAVSDYYILARTCRAYEEIITEFTSFINSSHVPIIFKIYRKLCPPESLRRKLAKKILRK